MKGNNIHMLIVWKMLALIVMNKQHARIAHDGHYISLQTLWSVQQEVSLMVPRPVSRSAGFITFSPHPPFMESLFTGCWSHKLLNVLCERLPYEVQHWQFCFLPTTPWTNAGDFPLSTPVPQIYRTKTFNLADQVGPEVVSKRATRVCQTL